MFAVGEQHMGMVERWVEGTTVAHKHVLGQHQGSLQPDEESTSA
jgi:hypothetical protein